MSYPGGKNGSGVYQQLISLMPPHRVYVEAFLGGGAVMRMKRPAERSIGIDRDAAVVTAFSGDAVPQLELITGDAMLQLPALDLTMCDLVYADPPYLSSTRLQHRPIYRCEIEREDEHARLLDVLKGLPCIVMISGYPSRLYDERLAGWRTHQFFTSDRGGNRRLECVWMNFAAPLELHDYRFLGNGYRERERLKRKKNRWLARFRRMPDLERACIMAAIDELRPSTAGCGEAAATADVAMGDRPTNDVSVNTKGKFQ